MANHKSKSYPKKSLGQNYLKDENICRNISEAFNITPDDAVLEIGPGQGAITKYLFNKTKKFTAVELDLQNVIFLKNKLPGANIIHGDILQLDLNKIARILSSDKLRIIGNIPYYITSEILFRLIDYRDVIQDAQLMVQEEVAQRLAAKPNSKAYGIISVFIQVYSYPELLFKVNADSFYPKPNVDSRVIHFNFENNISNRIIDIDYFKKFVKTSFGTRRKTLRNSLKNMNIDTNVLALDFDFNRRAETLSIDEFIELSNTICTALKKK